LGGKLLGWRTVCAVEIDPEARGTLLRRQQDGILERFPIWDDVKTFNGKQWRGVDVVSGGFPCQDISSAGSGAGLKGARSGLWTEFARIIGEVQPRFVLVENSPMLTLRGMDVVCGDLAALGYDAKWGVISACACGAPHTRERLFIVAYPERDRRTTSGGIVGRTRRDIPNEERNIETAGENGKRFRSEITCSDWWHSEPRLDRVANGVAGVLDRTRTIGNGQVPAVVKRAWRLLARI
jgi:DNA (cytosine-5)-methyltransferase 1